MSQLQHAGVVTLALAMLKAIPPARTAVPSRGLGAPAGGAASPTATELAPHLATLAAQCPSSQPYAGYRSDLLAVIANAAHKRRAVHDEVQRAGAVELVLAQCVVDPESPLAREWALWAVRNLCEGNEVAQQAIRELRAVAAVDSDELRRAGLQVRLDAETEKLHVSRRAEV